MVRQYDALHAVRRTFDDLAIPAAASIHSRLDDLAAARAPARQNRLERGNCGGAKIASLEAIVSAPRPGNCGLAMPEVTMRRPLPSWLCLMLPLPRTGFEPTDGRAGMQPAP